MANKYFIFFWILLSSLCSLSPESIGQELPNEKEIRVFMDMQMHPTMNTSYFFFKSGLQYFPETKEPSLDYQHLLKNVVYGNYLENNAGARIVITGAVARETIWSRKKVKRRILKQLDDINQFVSLHPDEFVVAKSPEEVRHFIETTDKTIIIHSIEGAKKLIDNQEDANFWAEQGVAFITLIHLLDSELGSSAIKPGLVFDLINLPGALKSKEKRGGLTEKGKNAIQWLANAGIMTDITHMSDLARADALDFMEENNLPPIATHDVFRPIQNHPRGLSEDQIIRIYQNGGFISLPISGYSLTPFNTEEPYKSELDSLAEINCYCDQSIDTYKYTYEIVQNIIENNCGLIQGISSLDFSTLSESEKVQFAIGFQSDFNGWLNHSKPRYGKKGCYPMASDTTYSIIDSIGLAHPGLMPDYWKLLENEGADLNPIRRSSERFLQVWSFYRERKFND